MAEPADLTFCRNLGPKLHFGKLPPRSFGHRASPGVCQSEACILG